MRHTKVSRLHPTVAFADWPTEPVPCSVDGLLRTDALVFRDDVNAYVIYRADFGPLGSSSLLTEEIATARAAGVPPPVTRERLAWPAEFIDAAAAAGCAEFLRDARRRLINARILYPIPGSFQGWVMEESSRAGDLRWLMESRGVGNVVELWGGKIEETSEDVGVQ